MICEICKSIYIRTNRTRHYIYYTYRVIISITAYQSLYVHTATISARRNQIRSRYLEKYLGSQVDSLEYLGLYMADMDTSDTVKTYSIKKHYDGGGVDGHYEIKINPVTLASADLYKR